MNVLGIAVKKNEIWYSFVSGSKMSDAIIVETGKQIFKANSPIQSLMMEFSNIFAELIVKYKPNRIAYKLYLDAKKDQIPYMHYSLGILNLVSKQQGVETSERTGNWIVAGKKAKIVRFCEYFKEHKFKNEELVASLIAWYELGE